SIFRPIRIYVSTGSKLFRAEARLNHSRRARNLWRAFFCGMFTRLGWSRRRFRDSSRHVSEHRIVVVGGGAAGFFAAIAAAEANPRARITVLEKGRSFLTKVRVSGGGRCNVTHACFDPK